MTDATASAFIATSDVATPAIRIGDTFRQAWKTFAAHWAIYSGVMMIAHAPWLAIKAQGEWTRPTAGAINGFYFGAPILFSLLSSAILTLAYAALYVSVSQNARGRPFSLGQALSATLRQSPALLAVILLISICSLLAAILLVFPVFIVMSTYAVASPACAVEKIGPIKAMSRSAFLTKGNRWRIFGFTLLLFLSVGLFAWLIVATARFAGGAIFSIAVSLPVEGVADAFTAVAVAVLYAQLRTAREGVDVDHIAAVFD